MNKADRYNSLFVYYGEKYGVDWRLLKAQAMAESNLDPRAKSPVGAKGLTQFMPATWREWWDNVYGVRGIPMGPRTNPEAAIELQAAYMKRLMKAFSRPALAHVSETDFELEVRDRALAAYNWGWGRVRKHLRRGIGHLRRSELPRETQGYIARISRIHAGL